MHRSKIVTKAEGRSSVFVCVDGRRVSIDAPERQKGIYDLDDPLTSALTQTHIKLFAASMDSKSPASPKGCG